MILKYRCLSIVNPGGSRIVSGQKTLEIRSWKPDIQPHENLLIIQNERYLKQEEETDPEGRAVALVRVAAVRAYEEADIQAACASRWEPGYYAWELADVRPVIYAGPLLATRGIYDLEIDGLSAVSGTLLSAVLRNGP